MPFRLLGRPGGLGLPKKGFSPRFLLSAWKFGAENFGIFQRGFLGFIFSLFGRVFRPCLVSLGLAGGKGGLGGSLDVVGGGKEGFEEDI